MRNILAVIIFVCAFLVVPKLAVSEQISHTIRCESEEFSPRNCALPVAPRNAEIQEIRKVRQLSSKPCIEGKSWMANESGITVRDGCRAEFAVVYRTSDRSDRRERWHNNSDSRHQQERSDDRYSNPSPRHEADPTEIVIRSFEDILNRRPSREEVRFYRNLMIDRGWTERQIRNELRNRGRSRR
ncbi:MAG: DUF3011 domain-containing protein [Proteobacteria bacterium]|nr:DUF3011 domain-containing protein [Pseudomonadota bacterium]